MAKKNKTSELDKQINEAKARLKKQGKNPAKKVAATAKAPAKTGRKRLSDEERAARDAAREAERAAKKAARDAKRLEREQAREEERSNAHMKKVEKARAKLPELTSEAYARFEDATSNLSVEDVEVLSKHLDLFAREQRTRQALETQLEVGQTVRITGGDARYIGQLAVVDKVQRIRCYVIPEGQETKVYLFTSDCTPVQSVSPASEESSEATGTEG